MAKKSTSHLYSHYISWYNKSILPLVTKNDKRLVDYFNDPTLSDQDKAKVLLLGDITLYPGCHQWYLKMYPTLMRGLLDDIVGKRLWASSLHSYSSFEDLYRDIESWLKRPLVSQLTIYDVALRLVIARQETRLMPEKIVYVHAKPIIAYRQLFKRGFIHHRQTTWPAQISINDLPEFGSMEPRHIENLLCEIGKGHI